MSLRYYIIGILWLFVMGLLFSTPQSDPPQTYFGTIPSRSILHGIMFLGFVHIWIGACKKQLKYAHLRRHSILYVFTVSVILSITSEMLIYYFSINEYFNVWNLLFDIIGAFLGILTFKLLYRQCY